jgi:nickel-dependent lactate racemase
MDKTFLLAYGEQQLHISLPEERILHVLSGNTVEALSDVGAGCLEALRRPIGAPPLRKLVAPGESVVILVSDITRAWGKTGQYLPVILDELNSAGIPDDDISILIAPGTHRLHTSAENEIVCGPDVCRRVGIYQDISTDYEQFAYVGTTSGGTRAYLHRRAVEADKVILTGSVTYHIIAGFGGGRKSVMPGISRYDSIQQNHRFSISPTGGINPCCDSGKLAGNSLHEDAMEVTAMLNPAFMVNAVFTPEGRFARFYAGDWHTAWEEAYTFVEQCYSVPINSRADVVIASAGGFPKDINFYQGAKTFVNAHAACKPGGIVVCLFECRDSTDPPDFMKWFEHEDFATFGDELRQEFTIPGFVAYKMARLAKEVQFVIVTKPENAGDVRKAGMIPVSCLSDALTLVDKSFGKQDFTITVMPYAANTLPLLSDR